MMDWRKRLENLGLLRSSRTNAAGLTRRPLQRPIEEVVPGQIIETPAGPCFLSEQRFTADSPHGRWPLGDLLQRPPEILGRLLDPPERAPALEPRQIIFLDTETTGLAGGTGTYAFLVGIGFFADEQTFVIRQFFMRDFDEEPAQLQALIEALEPFGALGSFNGCAFDVPILETRLALQRLPSRLSRLPHLDLLRPARRVWRRVLMSCALSNLEQAVLAVRRTGADVPSWMIPSLYFQYLQTGEAAPLAGVFYHNQQDILSMVTLANHLCRLLENPAETGRHPMELAGLARWHETHGDMERAIALYREALIYPLPPEEHARLLRRLSALLKRAGRLEEALETWQAMMNAGDAEQAVEVLVELAKFHEWQTRDIARALEATDQAIATAAGLRPSPARALILQDLQHRRERLLRKQRPAPAR
ncbi:MAG: ribonuclease H-like domain-containing protein [Anaerolineae bacterium]